MSLSIRTYREPLLRKNAWRLSRSVYLASISGAPSPYSQTSHDTLSSASIALSMSTKPSKVLAEFVSKQKSQYLDAIQEGKGREWVVAMGNEAGGTRTIALTSFQPVSNQSLRSGFSCECHSMGMVRVDGEAYPYCSTGTNTSRRPPPARRESPRIVSRWLRRLEPGYPMY